jgi:hypothetical protein
MKLLASALLSLSLLNATFPLVSQGQTAPADAIPNSPAITIVRSGSGSTNDNGTPTGLGNLIIGYDEDPKTYVDSSPFGNLPLSPLNPGDRGGLVRSRALPKLALLDGAIRGS